MKLSDYEISKVYNKGSFGVIYLGRHKIHNIQVAIKKGVKDDLLLMNEMNIYDKLKKMDYKFMPSFVECMPMSSILITSYLPMSLHELPMVPFSIVLSIHNQLIDALKHLHELNVVHRDIKPANVMVVGDKVKLIDFGLSADVPKSFSIIQYVIGSLNYCSVNVHKRIIPTCRDDLESACYVSLKLLCGELPWKSMSLESQICMLKRVYLYDYLDKQINYIQNVPMFSRIQYDLLLLQ